MNKTLKKQSYRINLNMPNTKMTRNPIHSPVYVEDLAFFQSATTNKAKPMNYQKRQYSASVIKRKLSVNPVKRDATASVGRRSYQAQKVTPYQKPVIKTKPIIKKTFIVLDPLISNLGNSATRLSYAVPLQIETKCNEDLPLNLDITEFTSST